MTVHRTTPDGPLISMPALMPRALRSAVAQIAPAHLPAFMEHLEHLDEAAGQSAAQSTIAPLRSFLQRWGEFVAIQRFPARAGGFVNSRPPPRTHPAVMRCGRSSPASVRSRAPRSARWSPFDDGYRAASPGAVAELRVARDESRAEVFRECYVRGVIRHEVVAQLPDTRQQRLGLSSCRQCDGMKASGQAVPWVTARTAMSSARRPLVQRSTSRIRVSTASCGRAKGPRPVRRARAS